MKSWTANVTLQSAKKSKEDIEKEMREYNEDQLQPARLGFDRAEQCVEEFEAKLSSSSAFADLDNIKSRSVINDLLTRMSHTDLLYKNANVMVFAVLDQATCGTSHAMTIKPYERKKGWKHYIHDLTIFPYRDGEMGRIPKGSYEVVH